MLLCHLARWSPRSAPRGQYPCSPDPVSSTSMPYTLKPDQLPSTPFLGFRTLKYFNLHLINASQLSKFNPIGRPSLSCCFS